MAWLYLDDALDPAVSVGDRARVTGDEAHHAASVARIRVGEHITIADGRGLGVAGPVIASDRAEVVIEVASVRREPGERPALVLAQALAKGGRDELAVQAATELGATAILPWQGARSVSRWSADKAEKGRARWASIAREAAKQSLRLSVPTVEPVRRIGDLAEVATGPARFAVVLDPTAATSLTAVCRDDELRAADELVLVVGPEGGLDASELAALEGAGVRRVHLGPRVLRTSTAGPVAMAAVQAVLGAWDVDGSSAVSA